ncbi:hypothetical protein CFC21_046916 [Triticum aestivum]|uniref:DUF4283 domain-containing protein n=2 Tax=Triticum aestivum TaxID=4565 RepID=A0A9R1FWK5_WHEAT|nr:hypothetical protein CFC21_046916 [Triticum aestivum]
MPSYDTLEETWIVIEGLPPKWISWSIISQISTMLGVLVNVDWHTIFRSFYEKVRIQVAVRDPAKIPRDRMVEIHHELYLLQFTVESEAVSGTIPLRTSILKKNLIPVVMTYLEKIWILEIATTMPKTSIKPLDPMEPGLCRSALHLLPELMKKM